MDNHVSTLVEMGFDAQKASSALLATGNQGVDRAVEWLLVHPDGRADSEDQDNDAFYTPDTSEEDQQQQNLNFANMAQSFLQGHATSQASMGLDLYGEAEEEEVVFKTRKIADIPYDPCTHAKHYLNVHLPDVDVPPDTKLPVVVHVHGGGWIRGDRNHYFYGGPFMGDAFANRGLVTVVISYRTGVPFPGAIIDVANAVKWTLSCIDSYGGDPNKIFLSGHSAGAHLASLLVTNPEFLRKAGVPLNTIKGVMPISGIYTISNPFSDGSCTNFTNMIFRSIYVTRTFGQNPAAWDDASPSIHLEKYQQPDETENSDVHRIPPFCIFNAGTDLGLEYDGKKFFGIMQRKGVKSEYHQIMSTNHGSVTKNDIVIGHCMKFINDILKQNAPSQKPEKAQESEKEKN